MLLSPLGQSSADGGWGRLNPLGDTGECSFLLLSFIYFHEVKILKIIPHGTSCLNLSSLLFYAEMNLHHTRITWKTRVKISSGRRWLLKLQDRVIHAGQWISWLVEAFSGQVLPSSCPFSWILLHFCSVASIAAGPQAGIRTVPGTGGGCCRASVVPFSGGRDKHAVLPEADQDFQLALRFCAIFGLTRGCYQLSLPLERRWRLGVTSFVTAALHSHAMCCQGCTAQREAAKRVLVQVSDFSCTSPGSA